MAATDLKSIIPNATAAELELVARYAMLPEDPRRERSFSAFAETGLPHRRLEAFKWSDFRAALPTLVGAEQAAQPDPFAGVYGTEIRISAGSMLVPSDWPAGIRAFEKTEAQAFGAAEEMPLGALTAALAGQKGGLDTLMIEVTEPVDTPIHIVAASDRSEASFARITVLVRPGASIHLIESHLGGAGFSGFLLDLALQEGASATRTLYQAGAADEAQAVTADVRLEARARYTQTSLAFGAKIARLETRLTHQGEASHARLNAAYLTGPGDHVDLTTHVRHGAEAAETDQLTKGAVLDGGRGVFQGKFHVPRKVGQHTRAEMAHHALLLENGAEVFSKPELEIYADDVECAHGNTCGALDGDQVFYLRQRGIPEAEAKALLTEAFIAEALGAAPETLRDTLASEARAWLARAALRR